MDQNRDRNGRYAPDSRGKTAPSVNPVGGVAVAEPAANATAPVARAYTLFTQQSPDTELDPVAEAQGDREALRAVTASTNVSRSVAKRLLGEETFAARAALYREDPTRERPRTPEDRTQETLQATRMARARLPERVAEYLAEKHASQRRKAEWTEAWARQREFVVTHRAQLQDMSVSARDMRPGDLFGGPGPLGGGVVLRVARQSGGKTNVTYRRPDGITRSASWNSSTNITVHRPVTSECANAAVALHRTAASESPPSS